MARLFTPVPAELRRSVSMMIRLTPSEAQKIRHAADVRCLDVSEFVRRAALGRKAEVQMESKIILALHHVIQDIRAMHQTFRERGVPPPDELLLPVMRAAGAAILSISASKESKK